jgi:uncharacterized protein YjeT (DUF2065 family)
VATGLSKVSAIRHALFDMGDSLWIALGLVLVIEGLLPFFNPGGWRRMFELVLQKTDGQLRFLGLAGIVSGSLLIWLVS